MPPRKAAAKKGASAASKKAAAVSVAEQAAEDSPMEEQAEEQSSNTQESTPALAAEEQSEEAAEAGGTAGASASSMEDRMAKMKALRARMSESAKANRRDLITDSNATRDSARNLAKLERKRKQAEAMGEKAEARETGEDLERKKAWEYSIEDNEKWDKKQERKKSRGDFSFTDYDDIARRKYKKDMDLFRPDTSAYNAQRSAASSAIALAAASGSGSEAALAAAQDLYRDANSFVYADHKPSEEAIDRVIGKINLDLDKRQKRSRERKNEDEGDITYINEKNKHFNKKLNRYYDAVTQDTRDSFERGTAL